MSETTRVIFSGMQVLIDQHWEVDKAIVVEGGMIKAIVPMTMVKNHLPAKCYEFSERDYLIPGLIDLHIHGANGHDVMDGTEEALSAISHSLAAEGVTGFLPTTMSASSDKLENVLKVISNAMRMRSGAAILGAHLEGPFIAKEKCGAQCGDHLLAPDAGLVQSWQKLTNNVIKMVTLAPELPEAVHLITALRKMNIIPSIGHTNATYEQTEAAIAAGCTQVTHLFNAMRGIHQRDPGTVGAALLSDNVAAELIVDGLHLHPAIVELSYRMKGKDKLLLVTDAMRAKCLGNGHYDLGGQQVGVVDGKASLQDGTLAGSTLRMPRAILNMAAFAKCSLTEAIHMASYNPARTLGLSARKGSIEVGNDADLAVLNETFEVQLTIREGREIYSR